MFFCLFADQFSCLFVCLLITWLSLVSSESKTGIVSNSFTFFASRRTRLLADLVGVFGKGFFLYRNENLNGSFLTQQLSTQICKCHPSKCLFLKAPQIQYYKDKYIKQSKLFTNCDNCEEYIEIQIEARDMFGW